MTPEKAAQLKPHLDAIAQLLYELSDPAAMQTLERIEKTVREQIHAHVSPELGHLVVLQGSVGRQIQQPCSKNY